MRCVARSVDVAESPPAIRSYLGQSFVTVGKQYEVQAVSVFEGIVFVQIVDDLGMPSWRPAWLFEVIEGAMAPDWICNVPNTGLALVIGPSFLAKDEKSYSQMVQLEAEQVERFWQRIDAQKASDT